MTIRHPTLFLVAAAAVSLSAQDERTPTARLITASRIVFPGDAYWGPAVHWNTYLERHVMLVNRARDETFNTEGIYVAYAPTLDDPKAWSTPRKIANGGGWYAQIVGLETDGTDRRAGQRARFFQTGKSELFIEFSR